jgi:hypothetical protein
MVYLLGQEYKHLHDTTAFHCLNIGTVEDFKIIKGMDKEQEFETDNSKPYSVYAVCGGTEKPIFTAPSIENCMTTISSIIMKHVTNDAFTVIDIASCIKAEELSGDEIITEMLEIMRDVGRTDLVKKFNEAMNIAINELESIEESQPDIPSDQATLENFTELIDTV